MRNKLFCYIKTIDVIINGDKFKDFIISLGFKQRNRHYVKIINQPKPNTWCDAWRQHHDNMETFKKEVTKNMKEGTITYGDNKNRLFFIQM